MRPSLVFLLVALQSVRALATPQSFFERYCYDCHEADSKKSNLSAPGTGPENMPVWVKIHDGVERGEMPPKKQNRQEETAKAAFLAELDARLAAVTSTAETGWVRLRRMTRRKVGEAQRGPSMSEAQRGQWRRGDRPFVEKTR